MKDELHAAAVVEEALGDDGGFGRNGTKRSATGDDVGDKLPGSAGADATLLHEPCSGGGDHWLCERQVARVNVRSESGDLFAQRAYSIREDSCSLGGFAFPERQAGRCAVGVFDKDATCSFDALDTPA